MSETVIKKVLNVGGNTKAAPLPHQYAGYENILLDIDPSCSPDILCDARELQSLEAKQFDSVFCSHNLEHYFHHDVPKVLAGFLHILKDDGFALIIVPDIWGAMRVAIEKDMDFEDDMLYMSPAGPVTVRDMLYSKAELVESSGQHYWCHKTGFTAKTLVRHLQKAGFARIFGGARNFHVNALAFKNEPGQELKTLWGLT